LYINKRGSSLSVKGGRFRVRNTEMESYIPVHQVTSIFMHTATSITHDVISLAIQHDIEILFIDRKGFPVGRIWSHKFGSISTIRKNQLAFSKSVQSVQWIREILIEKTNNQLLVLELVSLISDYSIKYDDTQSKLLRSTDKLKNYTNEDRSETFTSFRGYEGSASSAYLRQLSLMLPIQYQFNKRSQRPAFDPFNCLLNYAYGMLYGICESALITVGLDPAIGIMHRDEYNRPVLVYDFIEIYRHWADYTVCHLCVQEVVAEDFFDIDNQQFWLNNIGKRILIQTFNDYLAEIVQVEGLSRSRVQHLHLNAQKLATKMKLFTI
jgi:CRISP-associated protein Cas1